MALHTQLPIYRTGLELLTLAHSVQEQMPRGMKRTVDLRRATTTNTTRAGARPNEQMRKAQPQVNNRAAVFDPSNPEHMAARRARERTLTAAGPVANSNTRGTYNGAELAPYAGRPGAMDTFAPPSRMGNTRFYRDGRREVAA